MFISAGRRWSRAIALDGIKEGRHGGPPHL
jgi:hypothetical protein